MKKLPIFILVFALLSGCASIPRIKKGENFTTLERFSRQFNFHYQYNTVDDLIHLSAPHKDLKILLGSHLICYNGKVHFLQNANFYSRGRIYLSKDIQNIVRQKRFYAARTAPFAIKTIIIDPGHGGHDPGAISKWGLREKDVNLKVAKYLKEDLKKKGFKVYLTRSSDIFLTLRQRVEIARQNKADLFISIHVNSCPRNYVRGIEVFHLALKYFDNESKTVAAAENAPFIGEKIERFPFGIRRVLWDLIFTENNAESLEFAQVLTQTFRKFGFKVKNKGAPFYVLKYAYVPAVLVEIGFLSNYREEKRLRNVYYQQQVAEIITSAVMALNKRYSRLFRR